MTLLADDQSVAQRIFDHIDNRTTDRSDASWREPVKHYRCEQRFAAELELVLRRYPTPFCPSAALREAGSYVARDAAGTPNLHLDGGRLPLFGSWQRCESIFSTYLIFDNPCLW